MKHKEEGRKPAGGALHQGRAWASFFMGLSSSGQREGAGVPPMRGGAGCVGSAAQYEYVPSPSDYKNKIYPSPPCRDMPKKLTGSPKQK